LVVLLGALGQVAYQPTFFTGTQMNGVAVGTVVALGSAPIITGVLNGIVRRDRPTVRWMMATAIAMTGVVLVSGILGATTTPMTSDVIGVAASVGAGASYSLYTVSSKVLLDRGWSARSTMGAVFGCAAILSVPELIATPTDWLATPSGIALALWLGIATIAVGYLLFGWGLQHLNPTTVSTLTLAEPLGATVLGLAVLHEHLSVTSIAGVGVIALGLTLLTLPTRSTTPRVAPTA
jgi:DME family drug/metabolite transporter